MGSDLAEIRSGWEQGSKGEQGVSPCSHQDLILPGPDSVWHPAPTHVVQKFNQSSARAAGGREREARTVIPRVVGKSVVGSRHYVRDKTTYVYEYKNNTMGVQ